MSFLRMEKFIRKKPDDNKTINIIELNGLPGVGKTTICNSVVQNMRSSNIVIHTKQDIYENYLSLSRLRKIIPHIGILLKFRKYLFYWYVLKFASDYGFDKEILNRIRILLLYNYLINQHLDKNLSDILLLDEGLIQQLTSIPHGRIIKINRNTIRLTKYIHRRMNHTMYVNCFLDLEKARYRIQNRINHKSRFDKVNNERLLSLLNIKMQNLKYLRCFLQPDVSLSINMDSSVEENAMILINLTNQLKHNKGQYFL